MSEQPNPVFERTAIVVNPHSANGKTGHLWNRLELEVTEAIGPHDVFPTAGPGDATQVVRRALADGYDRIVSVGGDGTHYEVVNGFFEGTKALSPDTTLSFLPLGTGSDFRKSIGIPSGREAIPWLQKGEVAQIDVGRIRIGHPGEEQIVHFLNSAHVGVGGKVGELVNRSSKVLGGFATFLFALIAARLSYRCLAMKSTWEGESYEGRCLEVIVSNGKYDGGGMTAAPNALLDSGTLEVYILGNIGLIETLFNLPLLYLGKLHIHPKVTYFQTSAIKIESEERVLVSPDGELAGETPIGVEVVPKALKVQVGISPCLSKGQTT